MTKIKIKIYQWARRMRYAILKDIRWGGMVADLIKLFIVIVLLLVVSSQEFDTISRLK